jgi:hypothetical protein
LQAAGFLHALDEVRFDFTFSHFPVHPRMTTCIAIHRRSKEPPQRNKPKPTRVYLSIIPATQ